MLLPNISLLNAGLKPALQQRIDGKTKPPGSLGRLESLALQIGLIQNSAEPVLDKGLVLVFAGDHGLAKEGTSPFPQEVTAQMVANFLAGGAAINVFARQHQLDLKVVDTGVITPSQPHENLIDLRRGAGTRNSLHEPAMSTIQAEECIRQGVNLVQNYKFDALLPGEMGIGNTSAASLMCSHLLDLPLKDCIGRGAGHDDTGLSRKHEILQAVFDKHRPDIHRPIDTLAAFGGFEIGTMAGAMLGAASMRKLVVVDGFIATSAYVLASRLCPEISDYCVFSHASAESGHANVLSTLMVSPILDLGLRLGEGSGAAVCWPLLRSSVLFLNEMATFDNAGVSNKE